MDEALWTEKRAHLLTKLQLYQTQRALLESAFNQVQAELQAMGEKWVAPAAENQA
jgi:hypothetical protein